LGCTSISGRVSGSEDSSPKLVEVGFQLLFDLRRIQMIRINEGG